RIAELEKRGAEAEQQVEALKAKLQDVDKERAALSLSLQTREQTLQQQVEEKERERVLIKESLEEKLAALTWDAAQKQQAQQNAIAVHEAREKETVAQIRSLEEKLGLLLK